MNKFISFLSLSLLISPIASADEMRPTGDLGVVIEREAHSVLIMNTTQKTQLARVEDLGDLSHASVVFSRDERFAYIFGRDGGLSKIDLSLEIRKLNFNAGCIYSTYLHSFI